ncbi:MAG: HAD family hydrolase [Alphaproteobacteria bacterium]
MSAPRVLLFDLGGVIVRWSGIETLMRLTSLPRDKVLEKFSRSKILTNYELGHCEDDAFASEMIRIFSLNMDIVTFKRQWQSWVGPTYYGVKEALLSMRRTYTIACLSNTNALHWEWLPEQIMIAEYFDFAFASHLINAAKPAPISYEIPLNEMNVKPSDVWFFDDTKVNVIAARKAGMTAFHINRDQGIVPTLIELGLLQA